LHVDRLNAIHFALQARFFELKLRRRHLSIALVEAFQVSFMRDQRIVHGIPLEFEERTLGCRALPAHAYDHLVQRG